MSAHDRHLAARRSYAVVARCKVCHEEWDATYVEEYGAGWLEPQEDCPKCGASGEQIATDELDELDIQERKLEARGIDF